MKKRIIDLSKRRSLRTIGSGGLILALSGCTQVPRLFKGSEPKPVIAEPPVDSRLRLFSNTFNESKEGIVDIAEDRILIQKVGLPGRDGVEYHYVVPLNTATRRLNGGEPSFALIPEAESNIIITKVGAERGEINVTAPKGMYLPYGVQINDGALEIVPVSDELEPVRLRTAFKISDLVKPDESRVGKVDLVTMTEMDFPWNDEALRILGNTTYVLNRRGKPDTDNPIFKDALNMYFTKLPVDVEIDRTMGDNKVRIVGPTIAYLREEDLESYFKKRGYGAQGARTKEAMEKRHSATVDLDYTAPKDFKVIINGLTLPEGATSTPDPSSLEAE
tara:strand:+ start:38 stop:1036 length:999 start_codon:yes stop_codon:yes gene_type:complete